MCYPIINFNQLTSYYNPHPALFQGPVLHKPSYPISTRGYLTNEPSERSETLPEDTANYQKVRQILQCYCRKHDMSFGGHGSLTPDVQEGQKG